MADVQKPNQAERIARILFFAIFASVICYALVGFIETRELLHDKEENLFWLFSASAQSISTFVAFLIAGYTLYHSMMNELLNKRGSLIDIIAEERGEIFDRLKVLAFVTGASLLLNLSMLLMNGKHFSFQNAFVVITLLSTMATVIIGIWIVIYMIDPRRNEKTASRLLEQNLEFDQRGQLVEISELFGIYIRVEGKIMRLLELLSEEKKMDLSFREGLDRLLYRGVLSKEQHRGFLILSQYRNLLFHGHIEKASVKMIQKASEAEELVDGWIEKFGNLEQGHS